MAQKESCVGIGCANAKAGWAKVSHVPAIVGGPLFDAELTLAWARTTNTKNLVQVYKALGGGWK